MGAARHNDELYQDDGCDLHGHCLTCPLPRCRYDLPPGVAGAMIKAMRLRELLAEGLTMQQTAVELGVAQRTVHRLKALLKTQGVERDGVSTDTGG